MVKTSTTMQAALLIVIFFIQNGLICTNSAFLSQSAEVLQAAHPLECGAGEYFNTIKFRCAPCSADDHLKPAHDGKPFARLLFYYYIIFPQ